MKRLIIHIGLAKTGSSSLQRFFQQNASQLRAQGLCYPEVGREGLKSHVPLFQCLAQYEQEKANPHNLLDRFKRELAQIPEDCLISAEADRGHPWKYRELLGDCGRKVEILVYLRRQDERLESLINQKIKSLLAPLDITLDEASKLSMWDYQELLRRWGNAFGQDAIHPRIYNPAAWPEPGGIYADAVQALGLNWDPAFQLPARQFNPSLGYTELYILRHMKEAQVHQIGQLRQLLESLPPSAKEPHFTAAERLAFLQRFAESNRQVAMQYFGFPPERPLFPGPYPDPQDGYQPPQGPDSERMMQLLLAIWNRHYHENGWLRRLKSAKGKLWRQFQRQPQRTS